MVQSHIGVILAQCRIQISAVVLRRLTWKPHRLVDHEDSILMIADCIRGHLRCQNDEAPLCQAPLCEALLCEALLIDE